MSAANPNPMEKSKVSVLVVENAGGGRRCHLFRSAGLELLGVPAHITNILFILLSSLPCSLSSYTCYPIYYHTL
jgi:hypothetical protein